MARTRLTSGKPDKRQVKNTANRKGARPKIVTVSSIPARGELDAYGETFEGLPSNRLKDSVLSDSLLFHDQARPGYMPNTVGQGGRIRSIPNDVVLTRDNLRGEVVEPNNIVGSIPRPKLDLPDVNAMPGRYRSANLDWQDASVPKRAIDGVDWGQVDNKPNIVTPSETKKFLTKKEADRLYAPRRKKK